MEKVGTDCPGRAGLVAPDQVRAGPGATAPWPGDVDTGHHRLELRGVSALPGRHHQRQRFLALLAGQMHLGRQPAARTS
ncbi:hypothetical protein GCM10023178_30660 [Actinomadura luteofluorescens]